MMSLPFPLHVSVRDHGTMLILQGKMMVESECRIGDIGSLLTPSLLIYRKK